MTTIRVHAGSSTGTLPVGTAYISRMRGADSTEFSYDESFLAGQGSAISPDLPLRSGRSVVAGLPGALDDSAPDTWGRNLITRRVASQARNAGHPAPTPTEVDYLLGVTDLTRQGALRFCIEDGLPFLSEGGGVPRFLDLDVLLDAARRVGENVDADDAVATLLAAGSGSLGGARPKASVSDGNTLYIAKFAHSDDPWDVIRWEAVALDLADEAGLRTPAHQLIEVGGEPVLLIERFDRHGLSRIPYLSARSLIGAGDRSNCDYLELVEGLTEHGSDVRADLAELWRRIAFSIAINNTDDHMRNHAFLADRGGWKLSPIFDVNPDRRVAALRMTGVAGATEAEACRDGLLSNSDSFGLDVFSAERLWADVLTVTSQWRAFASRRGILGAAQDAFTPVLNRWSATQ